MLLIRGCGLPTSQLCNKLLSLELFIYFCKVKDCQEAGLATQQTMGQEEEKKTIADFLELSVRFDMIVPNTL